MIIVYRGNKSSKGIKSCKGSKVIRVLEILETAAIYRPVDSFLIIVSFLKKAGRTFYCQVISFCFIPAGKKEPRKKEKIGTGPTKVFLSIDNFLIIVSLLNRT